MCGIVGVIGKPTNDLTMVSYLVEGLMANQGRGYDGAGGAFVYNNELLPLIKGVGAVGTVFTKQTMENCPCNLICIGQARYATAGEVNDQNCQPFYKSGKFEIVLVHNGQIVNPVSLRLEIIKSGGRLDGTSDSELIAHLIANSSAPTIEKAVAEVCNKIRGAYSLLIMTRDKMIAVRDPFGIRPLSVGLVENCDGRFIIASSESCALTILGSQDNCEIDPGTMTVFHQNGDLATYRFCEKIYPRKPCIFEYVYFAHPGSRFNGIPIRMSREQAGKALARYCQGLDHSFNIDMLIAVPESGVPAAHGYHQESGYLYVTALTTVRGSTRVFMGNAPALRAQRVLLKRALEPEYVEGKKIIVVDDSNVRGTTAQVTNTQLKEVGGALEVHSRFASPPILYPCYYGMDISSQNELIAVGKSIPEIATAINADTCDYLPLDLLCDAIGRQRDHLCTACLTGEYPVEFDPAEVARIY